MASPRSETGTRDGAVALDDAFRQVTQGLSRVQEALRRQEEGAERRVQEAERRMQEALRLQEESAASALHDAVRQLQQQLLEKNDAIRSLQQQLNALSQEIPDRGRVAEETAVSEGCGGGGGLRRLEDRVEKVEVSLQRATEKFLPRVEALLRQLEEPQSAGEACVSTSITASADCKDRATTLGVGSESSQEESPLPGAHHASTSTPSTSTPSTSKDDHQGSATEEHRERKLMEFRLHHTNTKMKLSRAIFDLNGERLCRAAAEGRVNDVRRFINSGFDVNYTRQDGLTPLLCAVYNRVEADVLSLLLQHGVDVNFVDRRGRSPLHLAAQNDHSGRCVDMLIGAGADVSSRSEAGATPLHAAAKCKNAAAVRSLLAAGARRDLKGWDVHYKDKTPFDVAASQNIRDLLRP